MKILVFGRTGQVATELQRNSAKHVVTCLGREVADFSDMTRCCDALKTYAPDAVINAVAYTAVDKAEDEEEQAHQINATTPGALARTAAALGIPFVHVSTDYVFDGAGETAFEPDAPTGPLGAYGRTKLAGEEAIRAAQGVHAIFRTSWVVSAHGNNFVKTMLRLGREKDSLSIVADQIGAPTAAADIAELCVNAAVQLAAMPSKSGTYHLASTPDVSWATFAKEIFAQAGIECDVSEIPTRSYPTPARRPLNSRLNTQSTEATFGWTRPDWRISLTDILQELGAIN